MIPRRQREGAASPRRRLTFAGAQWARGAVAVAGLAFASPIARPVAAQARPPISVTAPIIARAIDHENAGRYDEAAREWRAVLEAGAVVQGVLGLERVYASTGDEQRLLPLLDSIVPTLPADPQLRGAQLRTLVALGRDAAADSAFRAWRALRPREVAPFRDYARILLFNNRPQTADSVLAEAAAALGGTRELLMESAQMRAALGRWGEAAADWREVMRDQAYYESAALFSLQTAPVERRDEVRAALAVTPSPIGARHTLALLELGWGASRAAWSAVASLAPSDTAWYVWNEVASEAERLQAWAPARDALVAMHAYRASSPVAARAAAAALRAQDPETALRMARAARQNAAPVDAEVFTLELEALARLGRGAEAERALADAAPSLGARARGLRRVVAWAWIRSGDVERARAALADATLDAEDAVGGWLALYEGDLATARRALRFGDVAAPEAVQALALLSRTAATRSATVGAAFLALARADSAAAVRALLQAETELTDAAPLLVAMAARIETARGLAGSATATSGRGAVRDADARAVALWQRLVESYAASPEAAEARLEWGRALRRGGDSRGARAQFEALILDYPTSALVPQARRELDALALGRGGED